MPRFSTDKIIGRLLTTAFVPVFLFSASSTALGQETKAVPERSEIDQEYLWNTAAIFPDDAAWEKEFAEVQKLFPKLIAFKGMLGQSGDHLLKFFELQSEISPRLERIYVYTSLLSDQDTREGHYQGFKSRVITAFTKFGAEMAWTEPELVKIGFDKIKGWMKDNAKLAIYYQSMDDLFRQQKHILSEREEQLITLSSQARGTAGKAYNLLSNADMKYPNIKDEKGVEVELDDSAFYLYMRSTDRRVRKDAYEAIVGAYAQYRNTNAALIDGVVQSHIFNIRARSYDSCLAAALDSGNIPVGVYNTLVGTINENLPLLHRYTTLRKKVLGLKDGVHAYDLFAPLTKAQKYEISYEDAVKTIIASLEPLGYEYLTPMKKGYASRWIDFYPTKGKRSGAYSSGTFLTQPFILLNFHGGYEDMSTTTHEMGHSMHSYFSRKNQPYTYSDYDIVYAEVASITNDLLLQDQVLKNTEDPAMKLYLLVEFLEGIRGTIFRQTMFSEFEQRIHEMAEQGMPLTADSLGVEYGKIMKKYYGPDYAHDDLVDNYWIRIPHFYYNFYVYKYATSYCAASNIASRILAGEPGAVDAYLSFLKSGSSKYPIDLLKMARVDMTTSKPIEDAMAIFEDLLDQTEKLVEKAK